MPPATFADPNMVPSRLEEPPSRAFSVVTLNAGWPEDLTRLAGSLAAHCGGAEYELVAISNGSEEVARAVEDLAARHGRVRGLTFSQHVGFGGGINAGIRQSLGEVIMVADTSIEAEGDLLSPIRAALADPSVGLVGPWGLVSGDLRHFHEETEGEVDAMQAYCIAFRKADVARVGFFDPKYKFYRNADVDFSLRWRDKGYRILALELPLRRHAHREWEALSEDQRQKKSRDNFSRLLRTWHDRTDLLTGRLEAHRH